MVISLSSPSQMNMGTRSMLVKHRPKTAMMRKILKIPMVITGISMEILIIKALRERIAKSTHRVAFRLGQLNSMTLCFTAQNRAIHIKSYLVSLNCISNVRDIGQALPK